MDCLRRAHKNRRFSISIVAGVAAVKARTVVSRYGAACASCGAVC